MEWLTLIIMATGGKKSRTLPVLHIENMVVLDLKYIQIGNTFRFSNHQQKLSHLHFYEMTFITKQSSNMEHAPFSFAFYGTKCVSLLLWVMWTVRLKLKDIWEAQMVQDSQMAVEPLPSRSGFSH